MNPMSIGLSFPRALHPQLVTPTLLKKGKERVDAILVYLRFRTNTAAAAITTITVAATATAMYVEVSAISFGGGATVGDADGDEVTAGVVGTGVITGVGVMDGDVVGLAWDGGATSKYVVA